MIRRSTACLALWTACASGHDLGNQASAVGPEWYHVAALTSPLPIPTIQLGRAVDLHGHVAVVTELQDKTHVFLYEDHSWSWNATFSAQTPHAVAADSDNTTGELVLISQTGGALVQRLDGGGMWESSWVAIEELTCLTSCFPLAVVELELEPDWLAMASDTYDTHAGRVVLFERSGGDFSQYAELLPPQPGIGFGRHIALDGNRLAVSSRTPTNTYVYSFDGDTWQLAQTLAFPTTIAALDLRGSRLAVRDETSISVFEDGGGGFVLTQSLPSVSEVGHTVELSDNDLAIGHPGGPLEPTPEHGGFVAIHDVDVGFVGSPWIETPPNPAASMGFGTNLDLHGQFLIVASPHSGQSQGAFARGEAHIYQRTLGQ